MRNCNNLAQDRYYWKALMYAVLNLAFHKYFIVNSPSSHLSKTVNHISVGPLYKCKHFAAVHVDCWKFPPITGLSSVRQFLSCILVIRLDNNLHFHVRLSRLRRKNIYIISPKSIDLLTHLFDVSFLTLDC